MPQGELVLGGGCHELVGRGCRKLDGEGMPRVGWGGCRKLDGEDAASWMPRVGCRKLVLWFFERSIVRWFFE
jgi:hypothetical protein